MKTKLLTLVVSLFTAQLSLAQLLYTEDFESYNTGPFSTDHTGATPVQGGWYTWVEQPDPTRPYDDAISPSVNHFEIVSDPNKGKLINIIEEKNAARYINSGGYIERTDLNTYWQQRHPGNNVLKLAFDIYTDTDDNDVTEGLAVALYNEKELLTNFEYRNGNNFRGGYVYLPNRGVIYPYGSANGQLQIKNFPSESWVTVELYIDYDNNQVYFSVPSLNYTLVANTLFPLSLTGGGEHDDNPVKLELMNTYGGSIKVPPQGRKIDNINLSAQNFTPTVSTNEFVSGKFNIFPNPATDLVTITNSENIGIKEIAVYDLNGKIVKSQKFKKENEILLNTEDLNSGTYFLHIVTDEGTGIKKLVKK